MTTHARIVEALCAKHGALTSGWNQAVAELLSGQVSKDDREDERQHVLDMMRAFNLVPDCYKVGVEEIDGDNVPVVRAWEVVITSRIKPEKLARYHNLSSFLDGEAAAFVVYEVDRFGHETPVLDEGSWVDMVAKGRRE